MARNSSLVRMFVFVFAVWIISSGLNELNSSSCNSHRLTPIGSFQGKLAPLTAVQLGSKAVAAAVEKAQICKEDVQELILGITVQAGLGQGPARQIALCAGLPHSTVCTSINKLCSSGMKAALIGCQVISTMTQEVVAVVGAESLSNYPFILRRKNFKMGNLCLPDLILHDGLNDAFSQTNVTFFAEETVQEYKVTREEQDNYALGSYAKAAQAQEQGVFAAEMVPIVLKGKGGKEEIFCEDEEIKRLNVEKFRLLTPEVGRSGTITAGNSSSLSDGAAAMILASGNFVIKKGLRPLARIVSYADSALHPKNFCLAPSAAIPKALVKGNLNPEHIGRWEISETFAITPLLNMKLLRLDPQRVNIHGGAISLGHPFGMTGARLMVHLSHSLKRGELGCASISHGTGGGSAVILEKMC